MSGPVTLNDEQKSPWTWGKVVRWVLGAQLLLLLAMAQVMFAGYRLGVGNQSIQIPFLKHYADPALYANDPMVKETVEEYSTYFFKLLAPLVGKTDINSMYFWLHVLTSAAVLWAAYGLGRAIFKDRASGVVLVLLMLAGHHRALAGDDLYSLGFTHTWAVFPLALWAMMLLYQEKHLAAFALLGVIFNLHALTAGYLLVMFLAWAAFDYRKPQWGWRLALMLGVFAVIAMPTMLDMVKHRQDFGTADWLERTRIRSGDHSFPSTWWRNGTPDVPRFMLLLGLAAVSLSFSAPKGNQRKSLLMAGGVGFLFFVGYVLSDIFPVATVVRAQLFRSSRLLVVLMLAHLAHGIVGGMRQINISRLWKPKPPPLAWRGSSDEPAPAPAAGTPVLDYQPAPVRVIPFTPFRPLLIAEAVLAIATFICLAIPGLTALTPYLLVAALVVALSTARLGIWQTIVACLSIFVVLIARNAIDYDIPGIDSALSMSAAKQNWHEAGKFLFLPLLCAPLVWLIIHLRIGPRAKLCVSTAALIACAILAVNGERTMAIAPSSKDDAWIGVQRWAAQNTPKDALFLTPPQQAGFRIYSGRSVVCEWRDGTQLYFSADFAKDWWEMLKSLRPVVYDVKGTRELSSNSLESMSDEQILKLAKKYGATHIVLPSNKPRELDRLFSYGGWSVYIPKILDSQEKFMRDTVLPNIETYRKSDARLELSDGSGQTITGGTFQITQIKQAFGFGCSLPFFDTPAGDSSRDNFEPPQVTPKELELFKAVFNYSVIPFSAKWQRIEPVEGERHYEELDKYVDWCVKNGITMEFHYLSGFTPTWVRYKSSTEQRQAWLRHCRDTVERYHDKIKYWQVCNDSYLVDYAADAIKEIRARYPDLKLGVSNCSQFYVNSGAGGRFSSSSGMMLGAEDIRQIENDGAKLDFYSTHGHKPMGVWPDMRSMYECFNGFAEMGVKIHISEATLDLGQRFMSPVRSETEWTPELAALFYKDYYTTAFSHPEVEAINYWDLSTSISRNGLGSMMMGGTGQAGLLDPEKNDEPRPLYKMLKHLIRDEWMTRLNGDFSAGKGDGWVKSDGAISFRGFHGDYEVIVTTAQGKKLSGTFTIKPEEKPDAPRPDSANVIQLKLIEGSNSIAGAK